MAPHRWSFDSNDQAKVTGTWGDPAAEALLIWAKWAAEGVCYAVDLDDAHRKGPAPVGGYSPDVLDVSHARWAAGSAVTALDLCAAVLGRRYCSAGQSGNEWSLRRFDASTSQKNANRLTQLPEDAQLWVQEVLADPDYRTVVDARDPLTHSWVTQNVYITLGADIPRRVAFQVSPQQGEIEPRDLLLTAKRVAVTHMERFLAGVMAKRF